MTNEWSNWSGSVHCRPNTLRAPQSEAELCAIIGRAAEHGGRVRVAGSGHSFTPLCASDDVLLSLDRLSGIESVNSHARRAWIRAGSKIHDLGAPLADCGLALENQGDVDVQALAGAVSTGTHGTGHTLGSISTQVVGVRIATADGNLLECRREADGDLFRAAQVALGALGVLTAIELQLEPVYRLHEVVRHEPIDACLGGLDERIAENRHFEFFWYSNGDFALTKTLNRTERPVTDETIASSAAVGQASAERERVAESWRIFPTVRENRFNEMEYCVPAECGVPCFLEIRALMQQRHPHIVWPVEYRTLAADEIFLSTAQGRPSVTLSIHQGATLEHAAFFRDAEQIFWQYGGRPHWAKMHTLGGDELTGLYPHWQRFHAVRSRLDPQGLFLNDYLRRIFGV